MFKKLVLELRTLFGRQGYSEEPIWPMPRRVSLSFSDFVSKVEELRPRELMIDHGLANDTSSWKVSFIDNEHTQYTVYFYRDMWVPDSWTEVAKDGPSRMIHFSESESVIADKFAGLWDYRGRRPLQVVNLSEAFYDFLRTK